MRIYNLCEFIDIENEFNNNIVTIQIKDYNNIINMSKMFDNCIVLASLPDISKWNT